MLNSAQGSHHYPWFVRIIFWLQKRKYGNVLNSSLVWAKSPRIFLTLSLLFGSLDRKNSPISPKLRSLIIVRVSQLNGCSFCIDINSSVLNQRGVEMEKILALNQWKESQLFDDEEKLILEYTEAVTHSKGVISEDLRKKLSEHYTQPKLVEMTALIAYQNLSTKFNNAFGVEPQGFCSTEIQSRLKNQ